MLVPLFLTAAALMSVISCGDDATISVTAAEPMCETTVGSGDDLVIQATLLLNDMVMPDGQVRVDANGRIACVDLDCMSAAPDATLISCQDVVLSPGLINLHDHLTFGTQPYTASDERYEHRHDWRKGDRLNHTRIGSGDRPSTEDQLWAELRQLISGTTSINGSGGPDGLLRNLDRADQLLGLSQKDIEYDTFPLGDATNGTLRASGCDYGSTTSNADIAGEDAYTPHIAEGIDVESRNEFLCLQSGTNDLIEPQSAVIHGISLLPSDIGEMAAESTGLIWSPRTNITLYGDTARTPLYDRMGVEIALGTDWIVTGSMNLLRELQCASDLNTSYFDNHFTDAQLWKMVTSNAAKLAAMDDEIGEIAVGKVADLALFAEQDMHRDYAAVVNARPQDVYLVLRGGKAFFGLDELASAAGADGCAPLDVCMQSRSVCVDNDMSLSFDALSGQAGSLYGLFYCETPVGEPTCQPSRNGLLPDASVAGSNKYTGDISMADDADGDGIVDAEDNCPASFNPIRPLDMGAQADADGDGFGDICDECPLDAAQTNCKGFDTEDRDADGIKNDDDNCPARRNADQADQDGDGKGDVCDACPAVANPGGAACPGSIYDVKMGNIAVGEEVAITETLVISAIGASGFFAQVDMSDAGYTGPEHSGIFVFGTISEFVVGDRISISNAKVSDFFGQIQLTNAFFDKTASGAEPVPVDSDVATLLADSGSLARQLEGVLVSVGPTEVSDADPEPGAGDSRPTNEFELLGGLRVDDAIFGIDPLPSVGDAFASVVGPLAWRNGLYKVLPRSDLDFEAGSLALSAITLSSARVMPGATLTATVRLTKNAPTGGVMVDLSTSPANLASLASSSVTIPEGQREAMVMLTAGSTVQSGEVIASYDGVVRMAALSVASAVGDPLISEYVEGAADDKAVEIFNASDAALDLTDCTVSLYSNGNTMPGTPINLAASSGSTITSLAPGSVFVLCNTAFSDLAKCDGQSGSLFHNGDDAIAFTCGGVVLDVIGQIGTDPGASWGSGSEKTKDAVLRRDCAISEGRKDGSTAFDPTVEWNGFAKDDFSDLGSHTTC